MKLGRRSYEERKASRIERLRARAEAKHDESAAAYAGVKRISDGIPMGQPVLVGHHSERHARRDIEKMDRGMRKSIDAQKAAQHYAGRAHAAESNDAISSDDPAALDKLRDKLAKLEALRAKMLAANKAARSKTPEASLAAIGFTPKQIETLLTPSDDYAKRMGHVGFADYQIKNSGAEVTRLGGSASRSSKRSRQRPSPSLRRTVTCASSRATTACASTSPGSPTKRCARR